MEKITEQDPAVFENKIREMQKIIKENNNRLQELELQYLFKLLMQTKEHWTAVYICESFNLTPKEVDIIVYYDNDKSSTGPSIVEKYVFDDFYPSFNIEVTDIYPTTLEDNGYESFEEYISDRALTFTNIQEYFKAK